MIKVPDVGRHVFILGWICDWLLAIFRYLSERVRRRQSVLISQRIFANLPRSNISYCNEVLLGTIYFWRRAAIKKDIEKIALSFVFIDKEASRGYRRRGGKQRDKSLSGKGGGIKAPQPACKQFYDRETET